MSPTGQTLHEFVLNLLTDDAARSAFGTDPAAALSGAGLQDITAQDVQEVVPLVLDYAPGGVSPEALESGLATLPAGDLGADGAIQQLQALAQVAGNGAVPELSGLPGTSGLPGDSDLSGLPGASDLSGLTGASDLSGLTGTSELPGLDDLTGSSFAEETPLGSVAGAHQVSTDGLAATGAFAGEQLNSSASGSAGTEGAAGSLAAETDEADLAGSVSGTTQGAAAAGGFATEPLSAGLAGAGGLDGVNGAFAGDTPAGDFGGDLFATTDGFAGSLNIAGQEYSVDSDSLGDLGGNHLAGLGEPTALDAAMPRSGEEAASATSGTLAGYVSTGGEWLADGVETGGTTLGGYLTGAAPADQVVVDGAGSLADQIATGTGQLAGQLENMPIEVPDAELPADLPVDAPIDTPAELPTDLPVDVPTDLPSQLPVELPELPELPVANPLPGGSTGGASESPLGQLNPGHGLPDVGDITGGLLDF